MVLSAHLISTSNVVKWHAPLLSIHLETRTLFFNSSSIPWPNKKHHEYDYNMSVYWLTDSITCVGCHLPLSTKRLLSLVRTWKQWPYTLTLTSLPSVDVTPDRWGYTISDDKWLKRRRSISPNSDKVQLPTLIATKTGIVYTQSDLCAYSLYFDHSYKLFDTSVESGW